MSRRTALPFPTVVIATSLLVACEGQLIGTEGSDVGALDTRATLAEAGPALDAPGRDAFGADASAPDAYTPGDAFVDPCAGVVCTANARCDLATRACVCSPGFIDTGAACVAASPSDPSTRTSADVCMHWRDGHEVRAAQPWLEGATPCDSGSMSREALDDTLRRIAMFRWMVGLPPVTDAPERNAVDQACANLMYRNRAIDHSPPMSWTCYSDTAARGASSSNLALGTGDAADAIDLYMSDQGVSSLGHRRWVLNDALGVVGIGFAGNAQCLGVFDGSGTATPAWTSWPNPGPVPIAALNERGRSIDWSFHSRTSPSGSPGVTITRVSDGANMAVTTSVIGSDSGRPYAVSFTPSGWTPAADVRYRVTLTGFPGGEISYEVVPVGC